MDSPQAMQTVGIAPDVQNAVLRGVLAVLQLGALTFAAPPRDSEASVVENEVRMGNAQERGALSGKCKILWNALGECTWPFRETTSFTLPFLA